MFRSTVRSIRLWPKLAFKPFHAGFDIPRVALGIVNSAIGVHHHSHVALVLVPSERSFFFSQLSQRLPSAIVFALYLLHSIHVLNQQPVERPRSPSDPLARFGNSMHDQAAFPRRFSSAFFSRAASITRSRSVASFTTESRYARASVSSAGLSNAISRRVRHRL